VDLKIPTQIARTNLPWWYWFFLSAMVISVSVQQVSRVNSRCMKSSRVLQSSNLSGAKELTLRIMCGLGFGFDGVKVQCGVRSPDQAKSQEPMVTLAQILPLPLNIYLTLNN
jgi:hypothetical protein